MCGDDNGLSDQGARRGPVSAPGDRMFERDALGGGGRGPVGFKKSLRCEGGKKDEGTSGVRQCRQTYGSAIDKNVQ